MHTSAVCSGVLTGLCSSVCGGVFHESAMGECEEVGLCHGARVCCSICV